MNHLTILTGASRGMGLAMAGQLCQADAILLCIARQPALSLQTIAQRNGTRLEQWPANLVDALAVAERLRVWLEQQDVAQLASAALINNAAIVGPVGPLETAGASDIADTLRVDLEAPMMLTAAFLAATARWSVPRKVLNISSGLGRRPMAGSALYCAAKAGMDHYSRCVALEQATLANGARIVSLAPGVIDTDMQTDLRASDPAAFPERANFVNLKETGALTTPDDAARRVLAFLARSDFGQNPIADVRDA